MAYTPMNGNRNGRVLLTLLVAAILAVAAVFGGYLWGHHTATAATQATASVGVPAVNVAVPTVPAGPTRIAGGIPSGFSHDRNGAIAAGIGFLQVEATVDAGMTSVAEVKAQLLAANPSVPVMALLTNKGTQDGTADPAHPQAFVNTPIAVKVSAVSATAAQLSFWSCLSGGSANGPGQPLYATTNCNLENIALSWERGDWKVADYLGTNGSKLALFELIRNNGYQMLTGAYTLLTVGQP